MPLAPPKFPTLPLVRRLAGAGASAARRHLSGGSPAASSGEKLDRIADELLSLSAAELDDYATLLRLKLRLSLASPSSLAASGSPATGAAAAGEEEKEKEKTAFDVRIEKFEAAAKIKVIKEVRACTDLGLKEAKELVEKAPVVVKSGLAKEEAEALAAKLKEAGAAVVLE